MFITQQELAAFHRDGTPIPAGLQQNPFPASFAFQSLLDCCSRIWELRLKQAVAHAPQCLLLVPSVKVLCSPAPGANPTELIAHQDSIVCQIQKRSLEGAFLFQQALGGDVANSRYHMQSPLDMHWSQTDIHRELAAVLASPQQVKTNPHRAHAWSTHITSSVNSMRLAQTFGQKDFQRLATQFSLCIAEQARCLIIYHGNRTIGINDEQSIRGKLEEFYGLGCRQCLDLYSGDPLETPRRFFGCPCFPIRKAIRLFSTHQNPLCYKSAPGRTSAWRNSLV